MKGISQICKYAENMFPTSDTFSKHIITWYPIRLRIE
jgi:hypothetical protein